MTTVSSSASNRLSPGEYNWATLIILPILGATLIALLYTTTIVKSIWFRIGAFVLSIVIVILSIFVVVNSALDNSPIPVQPNAIKSSQDPFTYDPGASPNGVVIFSGNASAFADQFTCTSKQTHTAWINGSCQCRPGFFGIRCEHEGFGDDYVSLTTDTIYTAIPGISTTSTALTTWPIASTVSGCTNSCTSNPGCFGVTYANRTCTQYTLLNFSRAPLQTTTIDPPILDTTLYLNIDRIGGGTKFSGYFTMIYGVLPVRYFVANDVTTTSSNVHVTGSGSQVRYYSVGIDYSFSGIPDFIIVNTTGILRLSASGIIPPRAAIISGNPSIVSIGCPVRITKTTFPFSASATTYTVRLDPQ